MTRSAALRLVAVASSAFVVMLASCSPSTPTAQIARPVDRPSAEDLTLVDRAGAVGIDHRNGAFRWGIEGDPAAMMGTGLCWLDYDNDGWLDLFVVGSYAEDEAGRWTEEEGGLPRSVLFHNTGGEFANVSEGSGADIAARGTGCVAADLDGDENTDLYVTTATRGYLLWNQGDGSFVDGSAAAGLDPSGWYGGAAVGDVNGDGHHDLFMSGYTDLNGPIPEATQGFPNTYIGMRDLLFLSNGEDFGRPTFREVGTDAGLEAVGFEYGLGATFSDLEGDGDLDLYVANDTKPNRLYDNVPWPGGVAADPLGLGFRFEDLSGRAGVADPNAGMGVAAGDFSGDGMEDIFVTNARVQTHAVYRSQVSPAVSPSFEDVRAALGIDLSGSTGWGVSWGDLDLDGDLDLVCVNGDIPVRDLVDDAQEVRAFRNLNVEGEPSTFEEIGDAIGLDTLGGLLARGSAMADYDNDGDLDVAVSVIGGDLVLLENEGVSGNWLEVALGEFSPGATVTIELANGTRMMRTIHAGGSYLSSEDPRAHFGLGSAKEVARVIVAWPGGATSVVEDVAGGQILTVEAPR